MAVVANACDLLETRVTQLRATASPMVHQHADKGTTAMLAAPGVQFALALSHFVRWHFARAPHI